jgi:hypothetical protein
MGRRDPCTDHHREQPTQTARPAVDQRQPHIGEKTHRSTVHSAVPGPAHRRPRNPHRRPRQPHLIRRRGPVTSSNSGLKQLVNPGERPGQAVQHRRALIRSAQRRPTDDPRRGIGAHPQGQQVRTLISRMVSALIAVSCNSRETSNSPPCMSSCDPVSQPASTRATTQSSLAGNNAIRGRTVVDC